MRVKLKALLADADQRGYGVPAFNYSDIWDLLAIVEAAEQEKAPIILASNPLVVAQIGPPYCAAMGGCAIEQASVPIVHHLDHSFTYKMCQECIDFGYKSVMIDASKYALEENITRTQEVVKYAHPRGVHVEGELGRIMGKNNEGVVVSEDDDFLTDVDEAIRFARETQVDSLAVGVGTMHGFYKGEPYIDFDRLSAINNAVDTKLVLHGGTGIPVETVREAVRCGINKVNVGTIIHTTYMNGMKRELNSAPDNPYTIDIVKSLLPEITEVVRTWIRALKADSKANF